MRKATTPYVNPPKPHYGPPRGSMGLQQVALDFTPAPALPKYVIVPSGGRFAVSRRTPGLGTSFTVEVDCPSLHAAQKALDNLLRFEK